MRWILLCVAALVTTVAMSADVTKKFLIEEAVDYDQSCILGSNDTANHIPGQTLGPIGVISSGSCVDAWTSGVNWSNGWETLTRKKVAGGCVKRYNMWTTLALPAGRQGFVESFNATPTGATANPCLHSDGKTYRKYEGVIDQ